MKKIISLITILVFLVLTVACEKNGKNTETTTMDCKTQETSITLTTDVINGDKEETKSDNGGGYIESGKYRQRYYNVPYDFIVLVGKEEYEKWYDEIYEFNQDKSKMVSFVQYFNISKADFEKTNLQMAKDFVEWGEKPTLRPMDYENQQTYEIYNADIIYTFDYDIINEYYLTPDYPYCADFEYEAAVKRGEYTSQTEEWVDIEQMEAEIIAKYGEIEIETTAEETVAVEESTAEITESAEQTTVA